MTRINTSLFLTFLILFALPAFSGELPNDGDTFTIKEAWVRPSVGVSRPTAAYGIVKNVGKSGDTLVGVRASIAGRAEIHKTSMKNGVMKMERVEGLDIGAGETLILKPKSFHVMLMKLVAPANEGDEVEIVFVFKHAGDIRIQAPVRRPQ